MFKLLLILGITAYFAYRIGRRVGENKPVDSGRKNNAYETDVIDAEIIDDEDK